MACSPWFPTRTPQWRRRSGGPVEGSAGGLSVHLGLPPPPAGPSEAWGGAGQGRAGVGGRHAGRATGNGSVCFLGTVHGGGSQSWPRARRCPRGRPAEGSEKGWGIGCTPRSVHAAPPGWVLVVAGAGPSPESWAQGRASRGRRAASGRGLAGVGEKKGGVGTTESNFCFSVELGWAGLGWAGGGSFFRLKISSPPFAEPLLFISSFCSSVLSEEPGLGLLRDVQKVAVPGSDADKPVGRGGACRCECWPAAWPEPSEHTNCTNSLSESCPWWWW